MTEAPKPFCDMLNWKLKSGSHEFPGPDGGTCLNEAAIIAAGFKYKKVISWQDCPPCFSPLISQFAIWLNDNLNYSDRQELMPFVTRIAGTKGSQEVEEARSLWLVQQIINVDLADGVKAIGKNSLVEMCRAAKSQQELKKAVKAVTLSLSLSSLLSSLSSSSLSSLLLKARGIELLEGLINFEGAPKQEIEMPIALERLAKIRETVAA